MTVGADYLDESDAIANQLVSWYNTNKRDLPWRRTRKPYEIWISETMLQQTRVDTVIPYYHAFLREFPTVTALARANEVAVLKCWQGLGYYSRARNLQLAAQQMIATGVDFFPNTPESFAVLPGVGPYTTGAVMSIAFGLPVPAVDGNVLRVITRLGAIADAIELPAVKRTVAVIVQRLLNVTPPADLTQAVMELGALVCTPKTPKCTLCPVQDFCLAYAQGLTDVIPRKTPKKKRKQVDINALWLERDGYVLMCQRQHQGLLADMWQLPALESDIQVHHLGREADAWMAWMQVETDDVSAMTMAVAEMRPGYLAKTAEEKHVFTHLEWDVHLYRPISATVTDIAQVEQVVKQQFANHRWVLRDEMLGLPIPRVYEKLILGMLERD